jgi:hypothetical protein
MITETQIIAFVILCICTGIPAFLAIYITVHCKMGGWHEDELIDEGCAFFGFHGTSFEKYKCKKCGRIVECGDDW